jgi:tRNA 2-selenouridine synthase SelU
MNQIATYNERPLEMVVHESPTMGNDFIVANTEVVTLDHLRNECIVPVFTKDNEITISHSQFIDEVYNRVKTCIGNHQISDPSVRVSHVIKGRVPTAIGKSVKELLDSEKTRYYERCAFSIDVPEIFQIIGGNKVSLSIGGVRAYNQENLYSTKSMEKFKLFIGFKNWVCTNLCISTDGLLDSIKVSSLSELGEKTVDLISNFNADKQLEEMEQLTNYSLNERQFSLLVGKLRMLPFLDKSKFPEVMNCSLSESQASTIVKDYHVDEKFCRGENGDISLWSLYNLMTGANKSSYIDRNFQRNANCFELVKHLGKSLEMNTNSWYLH